MCTTKEESSCGSNEDLSQKGRCFCWIKEVVRNHLLMILLLASTLTGIVLGIILRGVGPFREPHLHPREMMYLKFPGFLLTMLLRPIAVPMMFCSLISGISTLDAKIFGKVGLKTLAYYIGTTTLAVGEGLVWILGVRPGTTVEPTEDKNIKKRYYSGMDGLLDVIRNIFPDNLVTMTFQKVKTQITWKEVNVTDYESNTAQTVMIEQITLVHVDGINMMGVGVVAVVLGVMLHGMGERGQPLLRVFNVIFDIKMKLMFKLLYLGSIGLMLMIASSVISMVDPVDGLIALLGYFFTILAALIIHFFVALPIVYLIFTRKNPYKYMYGCLKAFGMACASNNSTMTLPLTMECLEKNLGKNKTIIRFMCPIGATVNMDGTALYEVMMVIFIAQLRGMAVGFGEVVTVAFVSIMVSIGATATSSGLIIYMILVQSIGLPGEDAFLLLPLDPPLARVRTLVNVWGDCVGVAVVEQLSMKHLVEFRRKEQEEDEEGRKIEVCDEVANANDLDSDDEDVETLAMKKMI